MWNSSAAPGSWYSTAASSRSIGTPAIAAPMSRLRMTSGSSTRTTEPGGKWSSTGRTLT
ncbi:hypothetical protein ACFQV2_25960 [Actinokineospora soli]|uniref:Uncharacterized protein n=1 Tax=Actinokineospora soli TaxID=1048753 RepID=A0ABW2TRF6_9PSEU